MTYLQLNKELKEVETKRQELRDAFKKEDDLLEGKINKLCRKISLVDSGLDVNSASIGEDLLEVTHLTGSYTRECIYILEKAIKDFKEGVKRLKTDYLGVKSYSRWNSQTVECEYFMGPTYGSVWFMVGLKESARKKKFTEDEIIACVRYLKHKIKMIQKLKLRPTTD